MTRQPRLSVVLAQLDTQSNDPDGNLRRHLSAIAEAQERGAELVVFPELSLSGYLITDATAWANAHLRPALEDLRAAAGSMTLVVGAPVPTEDGRSTNSALVITAEGIVHRQDKIYLPNYGTYNEGDRFSAGSAVSLFDLGGYRFGIVICEDAWHASVAYVARLQGADVILHPAASTRGAIERNFSSADGWETISRAEALHFATYVLFVNHAGEDGNAAFWGGSAVYGPMASKLAAAAEEPGLVAWNLDAAELDQARETLPMMDLEDIRLTAAHLGRLIDREARQLRKSNRRR